MTPERFERARELFEQAGSLSDVEQDAFLVEQCKHDSELRAVVTDLLKRARAHLAEHDRGHVNPAKPENRLIDQRIGPYQIRGIIGEGGMGAVYEAEHERTHQIVALKLVRPGLATPDLLRRFEFELQVLARLEHPGIARIYHAGTADTRGGPQPYFAMELVRGQNLSAFASERKLSIRNRLELAARIADAVQYAHQQGVIHRDLKPGNIFVTADGQPKILDFGVARATDSDVQSTTLQTDIGQLIGTLHYMSPEQAAGDPNQIDTRSDVYALGVLIYELLTARLPYALERRLIHEVVRIIEEEEPTRLSSLNKALRGDLETIVGKALEKDKERRYASANALAADIRRFLNDDPIEARPRSATYQLGKFARRNKVLVGGVAATFLTLVTGIVTSGVLLQRALSAEAKTTAALSDVTKSRNETKQVAEFLENMLAQVEPTIAGMDLMGDLHNRFAAALAKAGAPETERAAESETLRRLLARVNATDAAAAMIDRAILAPAARAIDAKFKDQPVVDASLRQALADQYREIGLYEAAYPLQESALATRRRVLGEEHRDTLSSIQNMGILLDALGRRSDAEPYLREALEKRRRVLGDEDPQTLTSINSMGALLMSRRLFDKAEPFVHEAYRRSPHTLGNDHTQTVIAISNMGWLLKSQGKLAEAEKFFRETLEKRRGILGEEHPSTLESLGDLGGALYWQGKFAEAEPYFREAMEKSRRVFGEDHPTTLREVCNMGFLLHSQNRFAEAEPYTREALEKRRQVLGVEHPDTLISINNMGSLLNAQDKFAEAEPYFRECLEQSRRVLGERDLYTIGSAHKLGLLLLSQGKLGEAEPYLVEALAARRRLTGNEHLDTLVSISCMGRLLQAQGKPQEAIDLLVPAEAAARKVFTGSNSARLGTFLLTLGKARFDLSHGAPQFAAAEANLLEARLIFTQAPVAQGTNIRESIQGLIDLYDARHAAEPEEAYDAKAREWRAKLEEWQASTQPASTQPAGQPASAPSTKQADSNPPTSNPLDQP